jgi:hypothetical protein
MNCKKELRDILHSWNEHYRQRMFKPVKRRNAKVEYLENEHYYVIV